MSQDLYEQWLTQNTFVVNWFDKHSIQLQEYLCKINSNLLIRLMGSRRWNLSYPESDIDATIICDDKEFHSQILDQLEIYYEVNYPAIPNSSYKKLKTLANLHLFVIDPFEESELHMPIKLEYSIQTVQQNQTIINHVTKELAKMSLLDKSEYAVKMREMYLTKDELGKARLKAFLKCL